MIVPSGFQCLGDGAQLGWRCTNVEMVYERDEAVRDAGERVFVVSREGNVAELACHDGHTH